VLPALEAFEEMLENPTMYYIFYEYFLRAAVGEEEWKKQNGRPKRKNTRNNSPTQERVDLQDKRLASSLDEAFALLVLKNNYFAWLLQAKEKNKDLKTDYDGGNEKEKSLALHLLGGYIIDLDSGEENAFVHVNSSQLTPMELIAYRTAKKDFIAKVIRVREKVKNSEEYTKIKESLTTLKRLRKENDDKFNKKKKQKLFMDMKKYTGITVGGGLKTGKGWSAQAFMDMFEMKKKMDDMEERYKKFGKAYRYVYNIYHADTVEDAVHVTPPPNDVLSDEQYKSLFNLTEDD
jgi:hypothetical protein